MNKWNSGDLRTRVGIRNEALWCSYPDGIIPVNQMAIPP